MPSEQFEVGQHVAWENISGIMTGDITHKGTTHAAIRRVDGAMCSVPYQSLRPAVFEDIEESMTLTGAMNE